MKILLARLVAPIVSIIWLLAAAAGYDLGQALGMDEAAFSKMLTDWLVTGASIVTLVWSAWAGFRDRLRVDGPGGSHLPALTFVAASLSMLLTACASGAPPSADLAPMPPELRMRQTVAEVCNGYATVLQGLRLDIRADRLKPDQVDLVERLDARWGPYCERQELVTTAALLAELRATVTTLAILQAAKD